MTALSGRGRGWKDWTDFPEQSARQQIKWQNSDKVHGFDSTIGSLEDKKFDDRIQKIISFSVSFFLKKYICFKNEVFFPF